MTLDEFLYGVTCCPELQIVGQVLAWKAVFDKYDADCSGFVDSREIVEMMGALLPQKKASTGTAVVTEHDKTREQAIERTLSTFGFQTGQHTADQLVAVQSESSVCCHCHYRLAIYDRHVPAVPST